jgi:RNA polymerase sigma-70 factor, ECF subfamily
MESPVTPINSSVAVGKALEDFLAAVEGRAYRTAVLATRKSVDALDIVQEAMLHFVQSYRYKSDAEWPLLFQRVLQNKIMDWYRAQGKIRHWFRQAIPVADVEDDESAEQPGEQVIGDGCDNPCELLQRAQDIERVIALLEIMPLRQRQAFLLRAWEGFDVATTAAAMECSEGSVKTHYFRAVRFLREQLIVSE